jgi:hypothetical protein
MACHLGILWIVCQGMVHSKTKLYALEQHTMLAKQIENSGYHFQNPDIQTWTWPSNQMHSKGARTPSLTCSGWWSGLDGFQCGRWAPASAKPAHC